MIFPLEGGKPQIIANIITTKGFSPPNIMSFRAPKSICSRRDGIQLGSSYPGVLNPIAFIPFKGNEYEYHIAPYRATCEWGGEVYLLKLHAQLGGTREEVSVNVRHMGRKTNGLSKTRPQVDGAK